MSATPPPIPQSVLWRESTQRADATSGFDRKKGHRIPDEHSAHAARFLRELSEGEVAHEIEDCYAALRAQLGYKRRQLQVTVGPEASAIATPDFEFHVVVEQDPQHPGRACLRRTIQGVVSPDVVTSPAFAAVFAPGFDGLDLPVGHRVDVEALIDHIEEREPEGWTLEYGHDARALRLVHPELPVAVHITAARVRLEGPKTESAAVLLDAAAAALAAMGGAEGIEALARKS